ncbi:PTS system, fructose-specific IIA component/phosphotransferase system, enzyme I, PtsI/phosphocarrier protein FPr [Ardenticatena maritima]|uniref:Phosphocarrier protein HPr n=1 Tax=Ardenticatena maritima TaxID=872965 RepID=A0A0M8KCC2_9CHLR|nr:phosphoenolpyruvate--protein phosphotransferase [Ardenticatena maritima]KPL86355.1 hypothetical protein SE16_13615 [Ardenticatena maritima]GAP64656.1 PTS system, fructose-specific IIA component/phosphotransferase system, enzyme I, PtsI/phosphocarrier protein FPr [Ardenticatena maritima]
MVGIVIVSHSPTLAEGVRELAQQMSPTPVPIALAAGTGDPQHPIGTNPEAILNAIRAVWSPDGVVVLMDLGSAILSAESALDFLTEEERARVRLVAAPLVEGALSAVATAGTGAPLEQVVAEARQALAPKQAHLGEEPPAQSAEVGAPEAGDELRLVVHNPAGLHARPAARLVAEVARYDADVHVRNITRQKGPVSARSINQLALLDVRQGDEIGVRATGPDAPRALSAVRDLVERAFDEPLTPLSEPAAAIESAPREVEAGAVLQGIPISPGIAIGNVAHFHRAPLPTTPPDTPAEAPDAEWARLQQAIAETRHALDELEAQTAAQAGAEEAAIFEAHKLFLDDPALLERARALVFDEHRSAEYAWHRAVSEVAAQYAALETPYLQARRADVEDVGAQVFAHLTNEPVHTDLPAGSILVAADLLPSDVARLSPEQVQGVCLALGGATAHAAILIRGLGIPAVAGVGAAILNVPEGTRIALDGSRGTVWIDPDEATLRDLEARRAAWLAEEAEARRAAEQEGATRDGVRIEVAANVRRLADAESAVRFGAEGVGLLRTEFLFMARREAPSEALQVQMYQAVAEALQGRPVIIRTLDVGGDKPLPFVEMPREANPFLGQRGIRFSLAHPDLFKTQLRAILRAAATHPIHLMFPMVSTVDEVRQARALLDAARREAMEAGHDVGTPQVGIMVETPSAVWLADHLATLVDFFSIGTNDLTQYLFAADRTNPHVAELADPFHPAVLRAITHTARVAGEHGVWVGVCGELAGDPLGAVLLVGLGVRELSMNPPAIPRVKRALGRFTLAEAQHLAQQALTLEDGKAVRAWGAEQMRNS